MTHLAPSRRQFFGVTRGGLFVKRIYEVLKHSKGYEGAINGSRDDAQKSLDRYVTHADLKVEHH